MSDLDPFFNPRSVAVIGASREPHKIGHVILKNFVDEFHGEIYPINPHAHQILGKKAYVKITDVPAHVDLAVIAVPAPIVPAVMQDCVKKKVKAAIIISGGFSEVGRRDLEEQVAAIAKKGNVRVVGVNCIGIFDAHSRIDTLFLPPFKLQRPHEGSISFISQSGAVGSVVLDWVASEGFGVSKFISYGNATDVNETDLLEYLYEDEKTKVICVYLEGVKDGRRLLKVARKVSEKKPIIVVKGGRTEAGSRAVSSHTGSLAGSDSTFDAAFKQAGMIRADGVIQMFDFARTLAHQPPAKGDRIQIITNGGGFGVLATDELVSEGLKLAKMSPHSEEKLKKYLPPHAVVSNPLDLVGDAEPKDYDFALRILENDRHIDAILCIALFQTAGMSSEVVDVIKRFSDKRKKPIVVCSAGGEFTKKHTRLLERAGVPTFDAPTRAARAIKALVDYGHIMAHSA